MPNKGTAKPGLLGVQRSYKVAEVAEHYGVSLSTIYREIKAGRLTAFRIGTGRGTVRVPADALAEFDSAAMVAARAGVA